MATYGKKKRGLLSSFSVFRDDPAAFNADAKSTTATKIARTKSAMQKPRDRQTSDEDSEDELAGDSLLRNPAHPPMRSSFQSDIAASTASKARSNKDVKEDRNKPLPPIPATDPAADLEQSKEARPALASKSTNRKIPRKPANAFTKPNISYPILQDSEDNDHNSALRAVYGASSPRRPTGLQTSVSEAEILSQKISGLMKQAAAQEAKQAERSKAASGAANKASPLQRSKAALTKATYAITDRLSSGSRRPSTSRHRLSGLLESSPDGLLGFEYQAEPKSPGETSLLDIPRKPLPVYESMKSTGRLSESSQNPFLDGPLESGQLSPELQAEYDFDFNKRKGKGKGLYPGSPLKDTTAVGAHARSPSTFSNNISGLAQHPDTMVFSSPPLGASTPYARLNSRAQSSSGSPSPGNATQTPSLLDFSFEESDDDFLSALEDGEHLERNPSVKRKNATEDLRSQLSPSSKKARKTPHSQADLATKLNRMDTNESGPLIEKDANSKSNRPATADSKMKGFGMFDGATGKGLLEGVGEKVKRPRTHAKAAKRLSIPTPNSILFSRESRAHYRLRDTSDHDGEDVDELQMDVGGLK